MPDALPLLHAGTRCAEVIQERLHAQGDPESPGPSASQVGPADQPLDAPVGRLVVLVAQEKYSVNIGAFTNTVSA